jgi:alpha-beta hydrolase superfamily lysophospholipase
MERITLLTDDGVSVVGDYQQGNGQGAHAGKAVLFLHMMPATRQSWRALAERLANDGFATLAIDFRGHGESTAGPNGTVLDRNAFGDAQHQAKIRDVQAAILWLMEKGFPPAKIALVGASIGANLAIAYAGSNEAIPAVVALSPGLEYHGVMTEPAAAVMPRSQKLLLAASAEDEYSLESVRRLAQVKPDAEVQEQADGGHGTKMLELIPGFFDYVAFWIESNVR